MTTTETLARNLCAEKSAEKISERAPFVRKRRGGLFNEQLFSQGKHGKIVFDDLSERKTLRKTTPRGKAGRLAALSR